MTRHIIYDRERILKTSRSIFLQKGFVSLHEITAQEKFSPQPIYSQFGSADHLWQEVSNEMATRIRNLCSKYLEANICPKHAMVNCCVIIYRCCHSYPGLLAALNNPKRNGRYLHQQIVNELYDTLVCYIEAVPQDFKANLSTILTLLVSYINCQKFFPIQGEKNLRQYLRVQIDTLFEMDSEKCVNSKLLPPRKLQVPPIRLVI